MTINEHQELKEVALILLVFLIISLIIFLFL